MFTIVTAELQDIPYLNNLIEKSVKELSATYYSSTQIKSALQHVFGVDTQLILDRTYFLVKHENEIAGCGGWSKRDTLYGGDQAKEGADPLLDPKVHAARIRAFFVHPNWARKGVGSLLLAHCASEASQSQFKILQLAATLPGVPFYLKLGFEEIERSDALLADGEVLPLCIMKKLL